ncbi:hypothetical protein SH1V18_28650 [Vallitalea longa]|uniref:FeoB-associated Cys-rich membrane protein n=1 Tax=Vallitalea longa TaxID=2936439 RepID=A0A9W5YAI8_9FIRM|nr:FeoB-associated Cys-rich membrane protein [Vallitalea longa]GKX30385.1 hypothetical protein SH1V18_28650 [Vallitalea longa]
MGNFIAAFIIILLVGLAIYKMYKDKKAGKKCSGCSNCPAQYNCQSKK